VIDWTWLDPLASDPTRRTELETDEATLEAEVSGVNLPSFGDRDLLVP